MVGVLLIRLSQSGFIVNGMRLFKDFPVSGEFSSGRGFYKAKPSTAEGFRVIK